MKRNQLQNLLAALAVLVSFTAQAANVPINTNITANTTWTSNNIYTLFGDIIVKNNATLTIEAGTIIKGDKSTLSRLVVTTGAKLVAQGTAEKPIVFTSNQPVNQRARADWAGIAICGLAPVNFKDGSNNAIQGNVECGDGGADYKFGGSNADDSSGVLSYVRIEYAGFVCGTNTELNSLTLCGVGRKTKIDHLMVSYGQDDGIEFFGGTVNVNHIISYGSRDDDFDTDNGWSGKAQFGLIVRIDTIADQGDVSNAFESDNDANATTNTPNTAGVVSNFTVIGPAATTSSTIDAKYGWGARLRRNTSLSICNTIIMGYKTGFRIEDAAAQLNFTNGDLVFKNNVIAGSVATYANSLFDSTLVANVLNSVTVYAANSDVQLTNPYNSNPNTFNFLPQNGSPVLTGADFSSGKLSGFTTTDYRGAFGAEDWTAVWAEFTPQDEVYTTAGINYAITVNVSQTGALPGNVTLTADDIPGATYLWSTNETTRSITVTTAGDYTVTATSSRGYKTSKMASVGSVGINEVSNVTSMQLVPNPNNGSAMLNISASVTEEVTITTTDVTGKVVATATKQLTEGGNQLIMNTANLTNGVYFVTVKGETAGKTIRMAVSK